MLGIARVGRVLQLLLVPLHLAHLRFIQSNYDMVIGHLRILRLLPRPKTCRILHLPVSLLWQIEESRQVTLLVVKCSVPVVLASNIHLLGVILV